MQRAAIQIQPRRIRPAALPAGDRARHIIDRDLPAGMQCESVAVIPRRPVHKRSILPRGSQRAPDVHHAAAERAVRRRVRRSARFDLQPGAFPDDRAAGVIVRVADDDRAAALPERAVVRDARRRTDLHLRGRAEIRKHIVHAGKGEVVITAAREPVNAADRAVAQARRERRRDIRDFRIDAAGEESPAVADHGLIQRAGVKGTRQRDGDGAVRVVEDARRIQPRHGVEIVVVQPHRRERIECAEHFHRRAADGAIRPRADAREPQRAVAKDIHPPRAERRARGRVHDERAGLDVRAAAVRVSERAGRAVVNDQIPALIRAEFVQRAAIGRDDAARQFERAGSTGAPARDAREISEDRRRARDAQEIIVRASRGQVVFAQVQRADLPRIAAVRRHAIHIDRRGTGDIHRRAGARLIAERDGAIDAAAIAAEIQRATRQRDRARGAGGIIRGDETAERERILDEERAEIHRRAAGETVVARVWIVRVESAERQRPRAGFRERDRAAARAIRDLSEEDRAKGKRARDRRHVRIVPERAHRHLRGAVNGLDRGPGGDVQAEDRHTDDEIRGRSQRGDQLVVLVWRPGLREGCGDRGGGRGGKIHREGRGRRRGVGDQPAHHRRGRAVAERIERGALPVQIQRALVIEHEVRLRLVKIRRRRDAQRPFLDGERVEDVLPRTIERQRASAKFYQARRQQIARERRSRRRRDVDQPLAGRRRGSRRRRRIEDEIRPDRRICIHDQPALVARRRAVHAHDFQSAAADVGIRADRVNALYGSGERGDRPRHIEHRRGSRRPERGSRGDGVAGESFDARGRRVVRGEAAHARGFRDDVAGQNAVRIRGRNGDGVDQRGRDDAHIVRIPRDRERARAGIKDQRADARAVDIRDGELAAESRGALQGKMPTAAKREPIRAAAARDRLVARRVRQQQRAAIQRHRGILPRADGDGAGGGGIRAEREGRRARDRGDESPGGNAGAGNGLADEKIRSRGQPGERVRGIRRRAVPDRRHGGRPRGVRGRLENSVFDLQRDFGIVRGVQIRPRAGFDRGENARAVVAQNRRGQSERRHGHERRAGQRHAGEDIERDRGRRVRIREDDAIGRERSHRAQRPAPERRRISRADARGRARDDLAVHGGVAEVNVRADLQDAVVDLHGVRAVHRIRPGDDHRAKAVFDERRVAAEIAQHALRERFHRADVEDAGRGGRDIAAVRGERGVPNPERTRIKDNLRTKRDVRIRSHHDGPRGEIREPGISIQPAAREHERACAGLIDAIHRAARAVRDRAGENSHARRISHVESARHAALPRSKS